MSDKMFILVVKRTSLRDIVCKDNEDILGGYSWCIKLLYGEVDLSTSEYEACPANFRTIIKQIQLENEKLCKKYAVEYSKD
jgi:hypothetical protein